MTSETGQYETFHFFECIQKLTNAFIFAGFPNRAEVSDKRNENEISKLVRYRFLNCENQNILRLRIREFSLLSSSELTRAAQKTSAVFCRLFKKNALVGSA